MLTKGNLKDGKKNGHWSFFYSSHKLHFQGDFKENLKHGLWTYFDEKGRVISKVLYRNGLLDSFKTYFDRKGRKTAQEHYAKGGYSGLTEFFDEEGHLSARLKNDHGFDILEKYHGNGRLKFRTIDWQGKKNDTTRVYHDNGQVKEELVFYKNILLAVKPTYNHEGTPLDNGSFENGKGRLIRYYDNGTKMSETYYSGGVKNGIAQFYHTNGKLKEAGLFNAGHKTGVWKYYNEEGELLPTEEYRKGMADIEFSEEFTSEGLQINPLASAPLFPGGERSFNKFIKDKIGTTLTDHKGENIWLLIDLDEFGFTKSINVRAPFLKDEAKKALMESFGEMPRCVPAFENSVPVPSSISQPFKI